VRTNFSGKSGLMRVIRKLAEGVGFEPTDR
jgi:hypothetical protein